MKNGKLRSLPLQNSRTREHVTNLVISSSVDFEDHACCNLLLKVKLSAAWLPQRMSSSYRPC